MSRALSPDFSTLCKMRSFPRKRGKTAFQKNPRQRPLSPSRVGKSHLAGGRESGVRPVECWHSCKKWPFFPGSKAKGLTIFTPPHAKSQFLGVILSLCHFPPKRPNVLVSFSNSQAYGHLTGLTTKRCLPGWHCSKHVEISRKGN